MKEAGGECPESSRPSSHDTTGARSRSVHMCSHLSWNERKLIWVMYICWAVKWIIVEYIRAPDFCYPGTLCWVDHCTCINIYHQVLTVELIIHCIYHAKFLVEFNTLMLHTTKHKEAVTGHLQLPWTAIHVIIIRGNITSTPLSSVPVLVTGHQLVTLDQSQ